MEKCNLKRFGSVSLIVSDTLQDDTNMIKPASSGRKKQKERKQVCKN